MNRILKTLMVLVGVVAIASPVHAAKTPKPPKSLCLADDLGGGDYLYLILAIKKGLKVKTLDGRTQFYSVQGALSLANNSWTPISGSGFIYSTDPPYLSIHLPGRDRIYSILWNLESSSGSMTRTHYDGPGVGGGVDQVDCETLGPVN